MSTPTFSFSSIRRHQKARHLKAEACYGGLSQ
uniref:Uncharacterized protein n=1 Tax=Anguilla anguilla TaxID=7936 RepID=A0A0E9WLB7_ANGAN